MSGKGGMSHPIGKTVSALHRYMQIYVCRSLVNGRYGIGPGLLYILIETACHEGLCQKEIAQRLMIEKATVAKAVKTLIKVGYIRTESDPADKRQTKVFLSEKGREIMPSIHEFLDEMNQSILSGFSPLEIHMAYALIKRMNQNLLNKLKNVGDDLNANQ